MPHELVVKCKHALAEIHVSFSGLVEVALRELLDRDDLETILEDHGATARRKLD